MALKKKITKAVFDKLSDEMKKLYKETEFSDTYALDTEDDDNEDPAELRRALARVKEENKKLKKAAKAAPTEDDDEIGDDDEDEEGEETPPVGKTKAERRAAKDAKTIDASWKKKHTKEVGERDTRIAAQNKFIEKQMIAGTADRIAAKISTAPSLMSKAIASRLSVDFEGDEPELVILGADGKPDAAITLDKLEKEFVANKEYAAIIIGSKASGGGAPKTSTETKTGGSAPASGDKKADLSKLTGKELADHLKAQKEAKQQGA